MGQSCCDISLSRVWPVKCPFCLADESDMPEDIERVSQGIGAGQGFGESGCV